MRSAASTCLGVAHAVAIIASSLLILLLGGMKCDESCVDGSGGGPVTGDWHDRAGAWQWNLLYVAGFAALALGALFLHGVVRDRRDRAAAGFLGHAALWVLAVWWGTDDLPGVGGSPWDDEVGAWILAAVLAGAVAVALTPRQSAR